MDTMRDAGEVKREVCHRLVSDWQELADHFDIPPHERARFDKGREPQGVWEWLEAHGRLAELSAGLAAIGREDLVEVLLSAAHLQAECFKHYYQACVERWSDDRYALDKRFVQLTLLLDQGEDAQGPRW